MSGPRASPPLAPAPFAPHDISTYSSSAVRSPPIHSSDQAGRKIDRLLHRSCRILGPKKYRSRCLPGEIYSGALCRYAGEWRGRGTHQTDPLKAFLNLTKGGAEKRARSARGVAAGSGVIEGERRALEDCRARMERYEKELDTKARPGVLWGVYLLHSLLVLQARARRCD